jgi:hypothetical protein
MSSSRDVTLLYLTTFFICLNYAILDYKYVWGLYLGCAGAGGLAPKRGNFCMHPQMTLPSQLSGGFLGGTGGKGDVEIGGYNVDT